MELVDDVDCDVSEWMEEGMKLVIYYTLSICGNVVPKVFSGFVFVYSKSVYCHC